MSLFKAKEYWSVHCNDLLEGLSQNDSIVRKSQTTPSNNIDLLISSNKHIIDEIHNESEDGVAYRMISGQFDTIGPQEVIIIGDLCGNLCIVDIPNIKGKTSGTDILTSGLNEASPPKQSNGSTLGIKGNVVVARYNTGLPIIDLAVGHFASTLKNSLAVLHTDKLSIYQIKEAHFDLLTNSSEQSEAPVEIGMSELASIHQSTHDLVRLYQFQLATNELALQLSLIKRSHEKASPQKDMLCVRYLNQRYLSIFDNKQAIGHLSLWDDESTHCNQVSNNQLITSSSFAPVAHVRKTDSLIISLSNYKIYSISLEYISVQSKQITIAKVAKSLSSGQNAIENNSMMSQVNSASSTEFNLLLATTSTNGTSVASSFNPDGIQFCPIKLIDAYDWCFEVPYSLVDIQVVNIQLSKISHQKFSSYIITMSRYHLDIYNYLGQQCYSKRFEHPLISMYSYCLDKDGDNILGARSSQEISTPANQQNHSNEQDASIESTWQDNLMILVASDLGTTSNMFVLKGRIMVWSSVLPNKPVNILRVNLNFVKGSLVMLSQQSQICVFYLGTHGQTIRDDTENDKLDQAFLEADSCDDLDDLSDECEPKLFSNETGTQSSEKLVSKDLRICIYLDGVSLSTINENQIEYINSNNNHNYDNRVIYRIEIVSEQVVYRANCTIFCDDYLECQIAFADGTNREAKHDLRGLDQSEISERTIDRTGSANYSQNGYSSNEGKYNSFIYIGDIWPDQGPCSLKLSFWQKPLVRSLLMNGLSPSLTSLDKPLNVLKSLKVSLVMSYLNHAHKCLVQTETFILPINLKSKFIHIDHSSGDMNLADIQYNLVDYKRSSYMQLLCNSKLSDNENTVNSDLDDPGANSDGLIRVGRSIPLTQPRQHPYLLADMIFSDLPFLSLIEIVLDMDICQADNYLSLELNSYRKMFKNKMRPVNEIGLDQNHEYPIAMNSDQQQQIEVSLESLLKRRISAIATSIELGGPLISIHGGQVEMDDVERNNANLLDDVKNLAGSHVEEDKENSDQAKLQQQPEQNSSLVSLSIGLKMTINSCLANWENVLSKVNLSHNSNLGDDNKYHGKLIDNDATECTIWIHITDLSRPNKLVQQLFEQHRHEWIELNPIKDQINAIIKMFHDSDGVNPGDSTSRQHHHQHHQHHHHHQHNQRHHHCNKNNGQDNNNHCNGLVMVSIECEQLVPVLFVAKHLQDRILSKMAARETVDSTSSKMYLIVNRLMNENLEKITQRREDLLRDVTNRRNQLVRATNKLKMLQSIVLSMLPRLCYLPNEDKLAFGQLSQMMISLEAQTMDQLNELQQLRCLDLLMQRLPVPRSLYFVSKFSEPARWNGFESVFLEFDDTDDARGGGSNGKDVITDLP